MGGCNDVSDVAVPGGGDPVDTVEPPGIDVGTAVVGEPVTGVVGTPVLVGRGVVTGVTPLVGVGGVAEEETLPDTLVGF